MNKKRIVSIIMIIIALILIIFGVFSLIIIQNNIRQVDSAINKDENINNEEISKPVVTNYEDAYNMAVSLYEYDDRTVQVEEKEDKFIIYVRNSDDIIINIFNMDKETGVISEEPISSSMGTTN